VSGEKAAISRRSSALRRKRAADPFGAPGDTLTVREVLDRGTERIRGELSDEPGVQSTLMHTMGDVYRSLGQFAVAIPLLEEAIDTRRASLGDDHPLVAQSLHTLGEAQCRGGQFEAGEGSLDAALTIRRGLPNDELAMGKTLESLGHLCLQFRGDLAGAAVALEEALEIQRRHLEPDDPDIAENQARLALVIARQGRLDASLALLREALESKRAHYGRHPDVARVLVNMAHILWWQGDTSGEPYAREAVEIVRDTIEHDHPLLGVAHHLHAGPLQSQGRLDEAEAALQASLAVWDRLGDRSFRRANTLYGLAWLKVEQGDFGLAEAFIDESIGIFGEEKNFGSFEFFFAQAVKGTCLAARNDPAAEAMLVDAFTFLEKAGTAAVPYKRAA
ncbi:MAG: tetratricopeptide repeat protein, partial [Acidobacteriota bacterium]